MTEYFVLYGLIAAVVLFFGKFSIGLERGTSIALFSFGFIVLLVGLRHQSMGIDLGYGETLGYLSSYDHINSMSWQSVWNLDNYLNYEKGYIILNKLVGMASGGSRQVLLFVCAVISIAPVAYIISQKAIGGYLPVVVYLGIPSFLLLFSGLRQSIALGICFYSLRYVEERSPFKFAVTIAAAMLFHSSAWVFSAAYFLYVLKINKVGRVLSICVLPAVYLFRNQIFNAINVLFVGDAAPDNNGSIMLALVFCLIYIFCSYYSDDDSREQNGYLNLFYVACVIQILGGVHVLMLRAGYYFVMSLVLLIPAVCKGIKETNTKILFTLAIGLCFVLFGLYSIYSNDWAQAFPYYWFWEKVVL